MQLSEITTEDGVPLTESGVYYGPSYHPDGFIETIPLQSPRIYASDPYITMQGVGLRTGRKVFIYRGRALGLFADRTTLETGLGRGA